MTRKKVKLAWIDDAYTRRITFVKRKRGLLKKLSELSILCGVKACAVVYGSYQPQPEIWPSPEEVRDVLARFKDVPEMMQKQNTRMLNQEGFLQQSIMKVNEQVKKQKRENREREIAQLKNQTLLGEELQVVTIDELRDMAALIEVKMKEIQERINELGKVMSAPSVTVGNDQRFFCNEMVSEYPPLLSDDNISTEKKQKQPPYRDLVPWSIPYFSYPWSFDFSY